MEIITLEQGNEIIKDRMPLGQFVVSKGDKYYAIENQSGDAWVEEFKSLSKAEKYLSK